MSRYKKQFLNSINVIQLVKVHIYIILSKSLYSPCSCSYLYYSEVKIYVLEKKVDIL